MSNETGTSFLRRTIVMAAVALFVVLGAAVLLPRLMGGQPERPGVGITPGGAAQRSDLGECLDRAKAYWRSVGVGPTMSDGRNTETVSLERCMASRSAF